MQESEVSGSSRRSKESGSGGPPAALPNLLEGDEVAFIALNRELDQHIQMGRLDAAEVGVLTLIHLQCDYRTLTWPGSAAKVASLLRVTEKQARRILEALESKGFIERQTTPGKRGNYPVQLTALAGRDMGELRATTNQTKERENGSSTGISGRASGELEASSGHQMGHSSTSTTTSTKTKERQVSLDEGTGDGKGVHGSVGGILASGQLPECGTKETEPSVLGELLVLSPPPIVRQRLEPEKEIAEAVFRHYCQAFAKNGAYIFTQSRKALLQKRAKDAMAIVRETNHDLSPTDDEVVGLSRKVMCQCIDKLKASSWHAGENDRNTKYQNMEIIFRTTESFEKWVHK